MKMPSDKDEVASDSFYERYGPSDFSYSRNDQCKIVDSFFFFFFEKQYADNYPLIDLLKFNYRKVKMDDKLRVFYDDFFYNKGASFKKKYLSVDYVDWFI